MNHRVHPDDEVTGDKAKEKMKSMVNEGKVGGLLGFVGEECVAWLSVDPIGTQLGHDYLLAKKSADESQWAIHCVYIKPEFRRKGFSKHMIEKGIGFAKAQGATSVLAFPIPDGEQEKFPKDEAEFSGRYSTYEKMGFQKKDRLGDFYQVMDLEL